MNYDTYESRIHISPAKAAKRLRRKVKRTRASATLSPIARAAGALRTAATAAIALFAFNASADVNFLFQPTTEADSKDAKIYNHVPGIAFSSDLSVTSPDLGAHFLSLVQFDISSFAFPSTDITSAYITLYSPAVGPNGGNGGIVTASPILNAWKETMGDPTSGPLASYNAFFGIPEEPPSESNPTGTPAVPPTLAFGSSVASANVTAPGYYTWDITDTVKSWVAGTSSNYGILFQTNTAGGDIQFSDVDFTPSISGSAPSLTITTVPEPGSIILALAGLPLLLARRRRTTRSV